MASGLKSSSTGRLLIGASRRLCRAVRVLRFSPPIDCVYNPLEYARAPHELYLAKYATGPRRVIFLGMNPGPFGMVQTGVPFGEIAAVRDWLGVEAQVKLPARVHPRRPILGFDCQRSEVSGQRLWGLFARRFGSPAHFFASHMVLNYCPLAFLEASGRNRTPDKLPRSQQAALFAACDDHVCAALAALKPEWLIGIGDFAFQRALHVCEVSRRDVKVGRILHPSPASPAANRDWSGTAVRQLVTLGVWSD